MSHTKSALRKQSTETLKVPPTVFLLLSGYRTGRAPTIDSNSDDDNCADDDLLDIVRPATLLTTVTQESHYQRPNHRADNASLASAQTATANHDCGNDVQLRAGGNRRITLAQTRHLQHSGQPEEQPRQSIDPNFQTISRNTTGACGSFVRTERKDAASENCVAENNCRANSERDGDPDTRRDKKPRRIGKHHEQLVQPGVRHIHCLLARHPLRRSACHAKHSEGCDEGHDFQARDHKSIYNSYQTTNKDTVCQRNHWR